MKVRSATTEQRSAPTQIGPPLSAPLSAVVPYRYGDLRVKVSPNLGEAKHGLISMVQQKVCVTHKHVHTEAEIREETVPGLPIISAEVYGWRELWGITEIKLHRQGTSNTEQKKKKNFLGPGVNDGLGTERERYGSSVC